MEYTTHKLEACSDCYYATEYGTDAIDDLTPERKARIDAGFAKWNADSDEPVLVTGGDEHGFVWASCEICGDFAGIEAYEVIAMYPNKVTLYPTTTTMPEEASQ